MSEFNIRLGARLKALRNTKKLTQEQVAVSLGTNRLAIGAIERGERKVYTEELVKLAKLFITTPDAIMNPQAEEQRDYRRGLERSLRAHIAMLVKEIAILKPPMTVSLEVPHEYDTAFSKNQWHGLTGGGKMFNNTTTQRLMDGISMLVRGERNKLGVRIQQKKTWVKIMVYRPDMKSDPINFLDVIADGVKAGLGIDDNLFAAVVDWELDPGNPGIVIKVEQ